MSNRDAKSYHGSRVPDFVGRHGTPLEQARIRWGASALQRRAPNRASSANSAMLCFAGALRATLRHPTEPHAMKRVLKYLLFAILALVAVLIALAVYISATFDPNAYKPELERLVKDKLERTLKIKRDIKLSFYPELGADLGGVSLSERGSEKQFAAVDTARVALQLLPLLSGEVVVNRVELRGLKLNLVKHANGSTNVDDLLAAGAPGSKQAAHAEAQPSRKPIQFKIDHVLVEDAELDYSDERSGTKYALTKLNLKTGAIGASTPSEVELGFTFAANRPKIDLRARLKAQATLGSSEGQFRLTGLDLGVNGTAVGFAPITLVLKGDLQGDAHAISSHGLALELDAKEGDRSIKAKLNSPLAFDTRTQTVELSKLSADLAYADPKSKRAPIAIKLNGNARAELAKQHARLDFSARLDQSNISGSAGLEHFSPPSYVFDLKVDKLDLDRYRGAQSGSGGSKATKQGAAAEEPLDFSALKGLRAHGSIEIGELTLAHLKLQKLRLEAKAGGDRLELNPLDASLYGGTMAGRVALVATTPPQLALKQNLSGINIGPMLRDAIDKDLIEGKGNVALDVSARGASVSALKRALDGSASLHLTDGALKGINIAATIRDAKAKLGTLRGESTQAASATQKTDFTELKASFAIRNGVAHNSDLELKSPLLRLGGAGDINIGADSIDYLAKATLVATAAGQGGKDLSALRGITIPVRITGPFSSLSYKLDFNALASGLVQQKIEQEKENVKSKLQDQLKNQLKGLFGR
jgi:AsmA protein